MSRRTADAKTGNAMFRSFAIFNYRVWFIGALVSNVGAWMQATALSWVVLTVLTDNDAGAMGLTMALQFAPPLLLVSVTGWVADRFDRRRLLMVTQSSLLILGAIIGVLLLNGLMTLPLMYVFALLLGIVAAFDNPTRQAFVSDLVDRENASNAVALNAASFNSARATLTSYKARGSEPSLRSLYMAAAASMTANGNQSWRSQNSERSACQRRNSGPASPWRT